MTQTDLAAIAGATRQSQSNYEKGKRAPDADYLAAIARAGCDVVYILTGQRLDRHPSVATHPPATQVQESVTNYRAVTPREAALLDLMQGLDDASLRDIQAVAAKEKQLSDMKADIDALKKSGGSAA